MPTISDCNGVSDNCPLISAYHIQCAPAINMKRKVIARITPPAMPSFLLLVYDREWLEVHHISEIQQILYKNYNMIVNVCF